VTYSGDLRRLRALYNYAVCVDPEEFRKEWDIADQEIFQTPTVTAQAKKKPTAGVGKGKISAASIVTTIVDSFYVEKGPNPVDTAINTLKLEIDKVASTDVV
jgi:hypothetical protein